MKKVSVYFLTEAQLATVKAAADKQGMGISVFLRVAGLEKAEKLKEASK